MHAIRPNNIRNAMQINTDCSNELVVPVYIVIYAESAFVVLDLMWSCPGASKTTIVRVVYSVFLKARGKKYMWKHFVRKIALVGGSWSRFIFYYVYNQEIPARLESRCLLEHSCSQPKVQTFVRHRNLFSCSTWQCRSMSSNKHRSSRCYLF